MKARLMTEGGVNGRSNSNNESAVKCNFIHKTVWLMWFKVEKVKKGSGGAIAQLNWYGARTLVQFMKPAEQGSRKESICGEGDAPLQLQFMLK